MNESFPGSSQPAGAGETLDSAILRLLMETIPDRIYFKDLQSRFVRVNRAYATWHGFAAPEQLIGKTDFDLFTRQHAEAAYATEQEIIRTGEPVVGKAERITRRNGGEAWGSTTKMPWRDPTGRIIGTFGLTRDITTTKQAEEKLVEEHNQLRTIIDHLPSRIFVKDLAGHYIINNRVHLQSLGVQKQEEASGRTTLDFFPGARGQQALADDRQVFSSGLPIVDQEKSDFGPEGDTHWSLTTKVPLRDRQSRITGLVGISHDITQRKRTEQELQRRTAEMEADLRMARQIQETFFARTYPLFPSGVSAEASALHFAHHYVPAATLGGDFFDILPLSNTRCGVLVCDVMGHGVRAGLLTALIRGTVEELGARAEDPAQLLREINRGLMPILEQTGQPVFATAFFGVFDTAAGSLVYGNAGHPPPVVLRRHNRRAVQLALPDPEPAAGLIDGFNYSCRQCEFHAGDMLLGYTDGLFEATDDDGRMFGQERLRTLIEQNSGLSGAQMIERLVHEVEAFSGHANFDDDLCVVAVESNGTAGPAPAGATAPGG